MATGKSTEAKTKKEPSAAVKAYLLLYNVASLGGWLWVLIGTVREVLISPDSYKTSTIWEAVHKPLLIVQSAMALELVHSIFGIVPSPLAAAIPQIASRLFLVWGTLWSVPETRTHQAVLSLLLSWSITEVVRYTFFAVKTSGVSVPYPLLWTRYSTFLLLYPTGISSEVLLIVASLPFIRERKLYSLEMPNAVNFAFDYFVCNILVLALYVPGSVFMYTYMMGQRKKMLKRAIEESKVKSQ